MKRIIPLLMLLLCLPLGLRAQGKIYTPDNLPKVHIQNKYRYTCDPERILAPAATDSIDRMLYRLEQQTGIETVVAVVPSIGEATCFDFCHELLNSWGVGKKGKDNGLVILLVTDHLRPAGRLDGERHAGFERQHRGTPRHSLCLHPSCHSHCLGGGPA